MAQRSDNFTWFLLIAGAVFLANVLTLVGVKVWLDHEAGVAMEAVNARLEETRRQFDLAIEQSKQEAARQGLEQQRQAKARAEATAQRASIRSKNDEVCAYWRGQLSQSRTARNRVLMDEACSRAQND
jgi:regulator of protease activity HflC (stomatin/prohibitin superfamily)